jgi:hypothetical protein
MPDGSEPHHGDDSPPRGAAPGMRTRSAGAGTAVRPGCRFSEGRDVPIWPLLGPGGVRGLSRAHDAGSQGGPAAAVGRRAKKRISAPLGLNVKTARRYIGAARADGLARELGAGGAGDSLIATVVSRVQPSVDLPHGEGWAECVAQRAVHRAAPPRRGAAVQDPDAPPAPAGGRHCATLRCFAVAELGSAGRRPRPRGRLRARGRGPSRHRLDDAPRGRPRHRSPDAASGRRRPTPDIPPEGGYPEMARPPTRALRGASALSLLTRTPPLAENGAAPPPGQAAQPSCAPHVGQP